MIQKIHLHFMKELQYQKQEEEGMMEIIDTFEKQVWLLEGKLSDKESKLK